MNGIATSTVPRKKINIFKKLMLSLQHLDHDPSHLYIGFTFLSRESNLFYFTYTFK